LNEPLLLGQIILLILEKQVIKGKAMMDIIPMTVSNRGLVISELFLPAKKKMVRHYSPKICDDDIIPANILIVLMTLSKQSQRVGHFL